MSMRRKIASDYKAPLREKTQTAFRRGKCVNCGHSEDRHILYVYDHYPMCITGFCKCGKPKMRAVARKGPRVQAPLVLADED